MCSPSGFRVIPAINETQAHFFVSDPPGLAELSEEHSEVVSLLSRAGVDVVMLSPDQAMPMQINTRDVGFVIGDSYFVSHMGRQIRQDEVEVARAALADVSVVGPAPSRLEGGDVLVSTDEVFVGIGDRTASASVDWLGHRVTTREVVPVPLAPGVLHLDCAMNLLGPSKAIVHPPSLADLSVLERFDDVLVVDDDEASRLATNLLMVKPDWAIVDVRNPRSAAELERRGITTSAIDLSHTTRIGGAFRCMTLPLVRF